MDRAINGREDAFDRLVDGVEAALNMELLEEILKGPRVAGLNRAQVWALH